MSYVTLGRSVIGLGFFAAATSAVAQQGGTLVYAPLGAPEAATAVPTLSGMAFVVLALTLGFVALRALRSRRGHLPAWALAAGLGALLSGGTGVDLMRDAQALDALFKFVELDNPNGGSAPVDETTCNVFENATTRAQEIIELTLPSCQRRAEARPCSEELLLQPGDTCGVNCADDVEVCGDIMPATAVSLGTL